MNHAGLACPICGTSETHAFECHAHDSASACETVSIRACKACDFAWQWPIHRTTDQSKDFFLAEYQAGKEESYFDKNRRSETAHIQLNFLDTLQIQVPTLLDIGCGDGTFVQEAAKRGWQATGIDPATPRNVISQTTSNPKLLVGSVDDNIASGEMYMCVTLWDVVEHLPNPEPILQQAWAHVSYGGWLILETGNYQSVERLLSENNWWAWQLDHRWYFAPPTLLHLLKPLGFSDSRLADRTLRPWTNKTAKYAAPSRTQTALSVLKRPWRYKSIVAEHEVKREALHRWPKWAGLQIFTLAVKKGDHLS